MCDIPKVWLNNIIWKCVINIMYWANTHPAIDNLTGFNLASALIRSLKSEVLSYLNSIRLVSLHDIPDLQLLFSHFQRNFLALGQFD